jgi:hypothetical protein
MTKTIEIVISPSGQTRVETKGFAGNECREASEFLETALGRCSSEQLTAEFYAASQQSHEQRVQES